jgi:glycerophosphoryl diester phosphodiesterase
LSTGLRIGRVLAASGAILLLLLLAVRLAIYLGERPVPRFSAKDSWEECGWPVAHALGGIAGHVYTNSLEAFEKSYSRGFRLFEVDLLETRDGELVAAHDWSTPGRYGRRASKPSGDSFSAGKIYGALTPLTSADVLGLLTSHRDVRLILDIKGKFEPTLFRLVEQAKSIDERVLDRIIPQIYHQEQLETALRVHPFRSIIYTLGRSQDHDLDVLIFVLRSGVPVITMEELRFKPGFARALRFLGAAVYVHTVNDPARAAGYLAAGATNVYTDSLPAYADCHAR